MVQVFCRLISDSKESSQEIVFNIEAIDVLHSWKVHSFELSQYFLIDFNAIEEEWKYSVALVLTKHSFWVNVIDFCPIQHSLLNLFEFF